MARRDKLTTKLVKYGSYSIASNSVDQFAAIADCKESFDIFLKKNEKRLTKKVDLV